MGYLRFFYVEAKSFEIHFKIGVGGIQLAERSRGLFRAVFLGRLSIGWLRNSVEALRKEGDLSEFCRTYQVGNTVYILQWGGNNHGRFLELSKYGDGRWRSFMIIQEKREGSGWANCLAQLRRLEKYYEK